MPEESAVATREEAVATRQLPADVLQNAERMIALLERGTPYHKAQRESGLFAGQIGMIYDNAPELRERIERACTHFKRQAKHVVLQKAVDQVVNGSVHEVLDREGNVRELREDVPVQASVALLSGLDKDFTKTSDPGSGNGTPQVVMNFNLPENVMKNIRIGNADVVAKTATLAMERQKAKRAQVVDITAIEEKKAVTP